MKKIFFLLIIFIFLLALFLKSGYAYPTIISSSNYNHTKVKELIHSIPKSYYNHVNVIEFVDTPICHWIKESQYKYSYDCSSGWNQVFWNKKHNCFNVKIQLSSYSKDILVHELGHVHEYCVLKKDVSTEEFAEGFRIQ